MAETIGLPAAATAGAEQPVSQPMGLSQKGLSAMEALGDLIPANSQVIKDISALAAAPAPAATVMPAEQAIVTTPPPAAEQVNPTITNTDAPVAEPPINIDPASEIDSPLYGGKKSVGATASKGKVIEDEAGLLGMIKSDFGQELSSIKDMPRFLKTAEKWRADAQKSNEFKENAERATKIIEDLPEPLFEAIKAHYAGRDYMEPISAVSKIDYNKSFEKQDKKILIDHYFPGKFTEEDFSPDATNDQIRAVEIAENAIKQQYSTDKTNFDSKRAGIMEKAKSQTKALKTSATSSVNSMKEVFPEMADDVVTDISTMLSGGPSAVLSEFFNADGTCKTDAAEKIALARHAKSIIDQMTKFAVNRAVTTERETILSRSPSAPSSKGAGGDVPTASPRVLARINELVGDLIGKNSTY